MHKYIRDLDSWKKELSVYDVDDTLIHSTAKIIVKDKRDGTVREFTTKEFTNFNREKKFEIDFTGFEDIQHIARGKLIKKYVNKLLLDIKNGKAVSIVTGRSSVEGVHLLLKKIGIDIPDDMIYTVTNTSEPIDSKEEMANRKQLAFIDLIKKGYKNITYYEDSIDNIRAVKELEKKYKDVKIKTVLVK